MLYSFGIYEDKAPLSVEETRSAIDELIAYEKSLDMPFSRDELAELFKKKDTLAPLGLFEGIEKAVQRPDTDSQEIVERYISRLNKYKNLCIRLNSPFSEEELTALFQKHSWGSRRGSREYDLLTAEEKYFVDKSGWTPSKSIYENKSKLSREEQRQELKLDAMWESRSSYSGCDTMKLLVMKYEKDNEFYYFFDLLSDTQFSVSQQNLAKLRKVISDLSCDRLGALWFAVLGKNTVKQSKLREEHKRYLENKYQETLELLSTCRFMIYDDKNFDCPHSYRRNYKLLTGEEMQILKELGLTPTPGAAPVMDDIYQPFISRPIPEEQQRCEKEIAEKRRQLKKEVVTLPDFLRWNSTYYIGNGKECFFIMERLTMTFRDCPQIPLLTVEKSKLRPDQIEFLEQMCKKQDDFFKKLENDNRLTYCTNYGLEIPKKSVNVNEDQAISEIQQDIGEIHKYLQNDDDEVMIKALKIVVIERNASTSYLQRKLKISYNRAAELLEAMEARGIVGPLADNGKREILADIPQKEAENQSE